VAHGSGGRSSILFRRIEVKNSLVQPQTGAQPDAPHITASNGYHAGTDPHPKPAPLDVQAVNIPDALKERPQWVCWKFEQRTDAKREAKWTKVPYNARTRQRAKTNEPATYSTYQQAISTYQLHNSGFDGIGFVVTAEDTITAGDLDDCFNGTAGELKEWARPIIEQASTYTERTPSGNGLRFFVIGKLPTGGRNKRLSETEGIELYDAGKFLTVTGHHFTETPATIEQRQAELTAIHARIFAKPENGASHETPPQPALFSSDSDLLEKAFRASNGHEVQALYNGNISGHKGHSEADLALCRRLAFYTREPAQIERIVSASGLNRDKWQERPDYRERTIKKAIESTTESYGARSQQTKRPASKSATANASSDTKTAADSQQPALSIFNLTDLGNAERFAAQHGEELRYCYPWGKWIAWDERRWRVDNTGEVKRRAKRTVRSIYGEATSIEDDARRREVGIHARKSEAGARIAEMIQLAASELPILPENLDRDPFLLNCINGTLDLKTGELHPHQRADLLTKLTPVEYDPAATCPQWNDFLHEIMGGSLELIGFLQRAIGYVLTGDTREQVLFMLHGAGANGKSTLLDVVLALVGDYGLQTDTETLMSRKKGGPTNDIARLRGARFVSTVETEEGRRLAEVLVKQLTGGDTVTARFLHQEFFEFKPECKLFLATNHKPTIRGTDNAIWRRIRLIPFEVTIPSERQDKTLPAKLRAELPGILAWAVKGCLEWQRFGLGTPKEVTRATESYRAEMDVIQAFIDDCCIEAPNAKASVKDLYNAYKVWCESSGEHPARKSDFGAKCQERGYHSDRGAGNRLEWHGVGLRHSAPETREKLLFDAEQPTNTPKAAQIATK
jgi:putative DNA primase/helicase